MVLYKRGVNFDNDEQYHRAFYVLEDCRAAFERHYKEQNEGVYCKVKTELYEKLAQICEEHVNENKLAIEYYKVIRNHYKIKAVYEKIIRDAPDGEEKIDLLMEFAEFLAQIDDLTEAKHNF